MENLPRILLRLISQVPALKAGVQEAQILELWPKAVGPALAKHTKAFSIKNQTLMVEVDHPIWKQELHANKSLALQQMNARIQAEIPEAKLIQEIFLVSPQPRGDQQQQKTRRNKGK